MREAVWLAKRPAGEPSSGITTTAATWYSQSDFRAHFGLGSKITVGRMEIYWPSGVVDSLVDIPADRTVTVREGAGQMPVDR